MTAGPLERIRILDLTHVWAGPLAVRFLADLGADVVKVEAPYGRGPREAPGEPLGGWIGGEPGPEPWNASAIFIKLNRNRRSLCVNLKTDAGRELFLSLVAVADIVVENFSARAMPSMGLDYETLTRANPNIIYVTMPGFGSTGPYRDRVAFGPTVEPMSGLTNMLGYGPGEPRNSAIALMDPIAATHAYSGVVTALRRRERDGHGSRVELSLHEGGVSYSGPWLVDVALGNTPQCIGNAHPAMAPHGIYPCQGDDAWLALACPTDESWRGLAGIIQFDDVALDMNERQQQGNRLDTAISAWTSARDKHAAAEILQAAGVAAGPVNTTPDMTADPQVIARQFFVPYEKFETPMPGNPVTMPGIDRDDWSACPRLGENNAEVLADWLDSPAEHVDQLTTDGILLGAPPD